MEGLFKGIKEMIEFDKAHSEAWLELMCAYQSFEYKLYDWAKQSNAVKYQDLLMEVGPWDWKSRDFHKRLLVINFLRSTEMWDNQAILLVHKELTAIALQEQQELAAYARMVVEKIKHCPERFAVADEVFVLAEAEEKCTEPDVDVFHNGCLLLYDLGCEAHFSRFVERYGDLIEQAYGLDKSDFVRMKESLSQDS